LGLNEIIDRCKKKSEELNKSGVIIFPVQENKQDQEYSRISYCGVEKKYQPCSFDNFQGGDRLKRTLRDMVVNGESVILCGGTGCGKTHLAVAMMGVYLETATIIDALFITTPDLLLEIRSSFTDKATMTEKELVERFSSRPFMVLDDLGAEKPTEHTIATLSLILDRRIRQERQTIITTNLTVEEIEAYTNARIASRISEMKNVTVKMPDYRKRR